MSYERLHNEDGGDGIAMQSVVELADVTIHDSYVFRHFHPSYDIRYIHRLYHCYVYTYRSSTPSPPTIAVDIDGNNTKHHFTSL